MFAQLTPSPMKINCAVGDATTPAAGGTKIIVHICNDFGG